MNDDIKRRMMRDGTGNVSMAELIQAIGMIEEEVARMLAHKYPSLKELQAASIEELMAVKSVGEATAIRIKAAGEYGKRLAYAAQPQCTVIKTLSDAAGILMPLMGTLEQEEVHVILLDNRNRVMATVMLYRGSLNAASVRVGEVFKDAIRRNAAFIILVHNHPSGDPAPSPEDVRVTKSIVDAGKILDIELLDHVIVAQTGFRSLKERGLGFD